MLLKGHKMLLFQNESNHKDDTDVNLFNPRIRVAIFHVMDTNRLRPIESYSESLPFAIFARKLFTKRTKTDHIMV